METRDDCGFPDDWFGQEMRGAAAPTPARAPSYMAARAEVLGKVHDCLMHFFNGGGGAAAELRETPAWESFAGLLEQGIYDALKEDRLDDPRRRCGNK